MARALRPLFRRHLEYVAVRPISVMGRLIQPGEPVGRDQGVRLHVMRSLHQRRRIGPKGHPWTEQAIASRTGYPKPFVSDRSEPEPAPEPEPVFVKSGRQWTIKGVADQTFRTKTAAQEWWDAQASAEAAVPPAGDDATDSTAVSEE